MSQTPRRSKCGGVGSDISNRLDNARNSFRILNNVWKSSHYSTKTKVRLYQSCVFFIHCTAQNAGG